MQQKEEEIKAKLPLSSSVREQGPAVEQKLKQGSSRESFEELFQLWHLSSPELLPRLQGLRVFPPEDLAGASVLHVIRL